MVGSAIVRQLTRAGYNNLITRSRAELDLLRSTWNSYSRKTGLYLHGCSKVGGILANDIYRAEFIYQNLVIQTNLIQAAHLADVQRLIFLGSSCVYPVIAPSQCAKRIC